MRVLVYPSSLELGGSLNAIELAAKVRDRGHDVVVFARPGPLLDTVHALDLEYVPLDPRGFRRPSPRVAAQMTHVVRERGIDLVHAYEWPPIVEACAGPRLVLQRPVVATIYSTMIAPFVPRGLPLILGAQEILESALAAGHSWATLIEPPVDTQANAPGLSPGTFRADLGFDPSPLLVIVCRLAREAKLEGLLSACDAVANLAESGIKVQLAIVGDGPARQEVEAAAAAANDRAGRRVVALVGALTDPRPAYAAADVVLGQGGSALRAMAFGKPLVIQGERGFWRLFTQQSAATFLHQGMYGLGPEGEGRAQGATRLEGILRAVLDDRAKWERLGAYGRELVTERFSLEHAAAVAEDVYLTAAGQFRASAARAALEAAPAWAGAVRHQARRKWRRWRGKYVPRDDFNVIAVEGRSTGRQT